MKYNRRKRSKLVVYLPLLLSVGSFLGFFYFLYKDGHISFSGWSDVESTGREDVLERKRPIIAQKTVITASAVASQLFSNHNNSEAQKLEFARHSYTNGIWWPKLLDINPVYRKLAPGTGNADKVSYPQYISLLELIEQWNPDHPDIPTNFMETLQHFNYSDSNEREIAARYRDAEVPFKLYAVPEVNKVTDKWTVDYLSSKTRYSGARVERAEHNHFMFWSHKNMRRVDPNWKQPTDTVSMSFAKWHELAMAADQNKLSNESEHYYFHTNAMPGDRSGFVAKDLSFFATDTKNFFITNVAANKGIQCRFGMRGIIAETHYDGGKNMVAMIKGQKRYILTPPYTCEYLGIISNRKHTSFRHSIIDWSNVDECKAAHFDKVAAIDTIVKEGEVLYIPSYWFHYPVSLQYSIQCNSRSGSPPHGEGQDEIEECMSYKFDVKSDVNFKKEK